jgi:hypothetical protein
VGCFWMVFDHYLKIDRRWTCPEVAGGAAFEAA